MPWADLDRKREYDREYRSKNRGRLNENTRKWCSENKDRRRVTEEKRKMERRARLLVTNAKKRVRAKGLEFNLDDHIDDLQARIDVGVCELTGYPFNLSGGRTFDSPSLDRIDASKGYTIDNVRVVLHCVNAALGDWGEEHLREVMKCWMK